MTDGREQGDGRQHGDQGERRPLHDGALDASAAADRLLEQADPARVRAVPTLDESAIRTIVSADAAGPSAAGGFSRGGTPDGHRRAVRLVLTVTAVVLIAAVVAIPLAVTGGSHPPSKGPSAKGKVTQLPVSVSGGQVTWRGLVEPGVYDTSAGLYLSWVTSSPGTAPETEELARVDATSGAVTAERLVHGLVLDVATAGGSLFVTADTASTTTGSAELLRLDPTTLSPLGAWQIFSAPQEASGGQLAPTDGAVWVAGGDRLDELSLAKNVVVTSIVLPGATRSDVTSSPTGSVLLVSWSNDEGVGAVEWRDPVSGALLASSASISGVRGPEVQGVMGDYFWVDVPTGMMGYVQLYDLTSLTPAAGSCHEGVNVATCVEGTNGIRAQLAQGLLWVTQPGGASELNYCADPNGTRLAGLPAPDDDQIVVGRQRLFLISQLAPGNRASVTEEPVPAACASPPAPPAPSSSPVLLGDGVGPVTFGQSQASVTGELDGIFGSSRGSTPQGPAACEVASVQWSQLTVYFFHGVFVGYSTLAANGEPLPPNELQTAAGLRVGDTLSSAEHLYGSDLTTSLAQGGTWFATTPEGRLDGYLSAEPNQPGANPLVTSIEAGSVGCPAASP